MLGLEFLCYLRRLEYKTVAEQIGVSPATIQDWLKGRRKIPDQRLDQLGDLFDINKEFLRSYLSKEEETIMRVRELEKEASLLGYELTKI